MNIKTSIIGLGKIGIKYDKKHKYKIGNYTSAVIENKNLKLVSVCDISNSNITNYKKKIESIFFKSLDRLLEKSKPELIIVCSSTKNQ